jgi:predicted transcriptional regulator
VTEPDGEPTYPSLLEAAALLGMHPDTLRWHLTHSGNSARVWRDGRAYLPMSLEEADQLLQSRRQATIDRQEAIATLPGLSAQRVAHLLGIRKNTVYRLNELRTLPAEAETMIGRRKILRWNPLTVRAYAERVGRTLTE